jgi:hypothetical protein
VESQRFFSRSGPSNESPVIHQQANSGARTVQPQGTEGGFNRGGNAAGMTQPQQGVGRPGWRNFGSGNVESQGSAQTQAHGMNSANQRGGANQPQQNADRPGGRGFGSTNSGAGTQAVPEISRPAQGVQQGQRPYAPPAAQQQTPSNQPSESSRPGWRTFNSPARTTQPSEPANSGNRNFERQGNAPQSRPSYSPPPEPSNGGGRNFGRQEVVPQSRPNNPQPAESPRQFQPSSRANSGNSGNYGNSRPPLEMRQPIVTPRGGGNYESRPSGGSYSAPRSMPSGEYRGGQSGGGGNSGGGSRGGNSGGENSGGRSSGGSNSSGGHESSGRNHR